MRVALKRNGEVWRAVDPFTSWRRMGDGIESLGGCVRTTAKRAHVYAVHNDGRVVEAVQRAPMTQTLTGFSAIAGPAVRRVSAVRLRGDTIALFTADRVDGRVRVARQNTTENQRVGQQNVYVKPAWTEWIELGSDADQFAPATFDGGRVLLTALGPDGEVGSRLSTGRGIDSWLNWDTIWTSR